MQAKILTANEKRELQQKACQIIDHVSWLAERNDARDIPEYWSYNLIDLIDYFAGPEDCKHVASLVCKNDAIPSECKGHLKKYFNLFY